MERTGTLYIQAAKRGEQTVVTDCLFEGAFKVARPVYLERSYPTIYCIHVGGGYVDGDIYETHISLEEQARLTVTTQASTKVYKTPRRPVQQLTKIFLKKDSILEFLPDPLIAYEKSRFIQETTIHMEKGATLLYSDIITPGWSPGGAPFQYEWVRSKLKVYEDGMLQIYDHLFLQPDQQNMASIMQMEGYTHFGSLLLVSSSTSAQVMKELEHLLEAYNDDTSMRVGSSALKTSGIVIRVLAKQTQAIERLFEACTNILRSSWQQEPVYLRKY